jgi:hypothetical protein
MNYVWNITDATNIDGLITSASYTVTLIDGSDQIESEGHWVFDSPAMVTPYNQVTKEMIVQWIENASIVDGTSSIKSNLEKQLNALRARQRTGLPWIVGTFTI